MKRIAYNLARDRRIAPGGFALRAGLLLLAALLLGGLTVTNVLRLRRQDLAAQSESGRMASRLAEISRLGEQRRQEIAAWKGQWQGELAAANRLIERKSFSFIRRLDFLERNFSPGIRVRQLSLVNEPGGQVGLSISSQSLKELFALYKKLAPYGLVISSETQTLDELQVNLLFRIRDEKI